MILRWLGVGVALAALLPAGCGHKRCCPQQATSAYPCCPKPCDPCATGAPGPVGVPTQAFSAPLAGGPGCCNGR